MQENLLRDKSFAFALRTINLNKYLVKDCREYTFSKQVLRSGTSIGANIEESIHARSKIDFIHRLSIAQKEVSETRYWIRLLKESNYVMPNHADSLLSDCEEIQRLLAASVKTAKRNLEKERG